MPHEPAEHPRNLPARAYANTAARPGAGPPLNLTSALAEALVAAVGIYPSLTSAAHACGCSIQTVGHYVRRGSMPGAPPILAEFSKEYARAIADHGRDKLEQFERACKDGNPAAGVLFKYIEKRFSDKEGVSVEGMLNGSGRRSDNLEELLRNPTPRLLGLLHRTGWRRPDDWNHPGVIPTEGTERPSE